MQRKHLHLLCALFLVTPLAARAEFSFQRTTQITGGTVLQSVQSLGFISSAARKVGDPQTTTTYIKGDRMAVVSEDSIAIYDVAHETLTRIDLKRRTWYTLTFQQMRENMERMQQQMHSQPQVNTDPTAEGSFQVKVHSTGAKKSVSDLPASESILTMVATATNTQTQQSANFALTSDMWLTPTVRGYEELRAFELKLAQKLAPNLVPGVQDFTRALMSNPKAMASLADLTNEMRKLKGVPVFQIIRIGSTPDGTPLPAASEAPLPQSNGPSASDAAKQGATSALAARLPFGGLAHHKAADPAPAAPAGPSVLMESQATLSNFSTDGIDASHFEVPAGFKETKAPEYAH